MKNVNGLVSLCHGRCPPCPAETATATERTGANPTSLNRSDSPTRGNTGRGELGYNLTGVHTFLGHFLAVHQLFPTRSRDGACEYYVHHYRGPRPLSIRRWRHRYWKNPTLTGRMGGAKKVPGTGCDRTRARTDTLPVRTTVVFEEFGILRSEKLCIYNKTTLFIFNRQVLPPPSHRSFHRCWTATPHRARVKHWLPGGERLTRCIILWPGVVPYIFVRDDGVNGTVGHAIKCISTDTGSARHHQRARPDTLRAYK